MSKPWDEFSATHNAPVIDELVRAHSGDEVRWRVRLVGCDESVRVNADTLNNYRYFRNACADQLGLFLPDLQKGEWASILMDAQRSLKIEQP